MRRTSLRRYTNLAAAINLLTVQKITLLDPSTWDDRNDAFFMSEYKKKISASSVLALCFAESQETYHHWRVFSHGSDGVCIEFDKDCLLNAFNSDAGIQHGEMQYILLPDARQMTIKTEELPYLKRRPYKDEMEYRAVYVDLNEPKPFHDISISLDCINRITLSPWLPTSLADSVKALLKKISGCSELEVVRSTLIENQEWKKLAGRATPEASHRQRHFTTLDVGCATTP